MSKNKKLELTWIGKDRIPRVEPRVLLENETYSFHANKRFSESDSFDNWLIHGDNLLALRALEHQFAGTVTLIYIDPPFNTGQAFEQYEDGIQHSQWLTLMRDRLVVLRRLLAPNGSIWVHCDDSEQAYLKVVMDEEFGRDNFVTVFIWQKVDSPNDNKVPITPDHEYILCYTKTPERAQFRQMQDESVLVAYRAKDADGKLFRDRLLKKNGKNSLRADRPKMFFEIPDPDGNPVLPMHDDGREACWAYGKKKVFEMLHHGQIVWKKRGEAGQERWVPYTREYAPTEPARPYPTIWTDCNTSRQAKAHLKELLPDVPVFATPKPEELIARILMIASNEGDLVLDSFLGSGTTAAVAHKLKRRWIGVELGEHCFSHVIPRLTKVVNGHDYGGITEKCDWSGGGGFRFFGIAPSLLQKDHWDNWVISKQYNSAMLAEAMCKLEGFNYAPSQERYWQHGNSTERDFIYVTTQKLTQQQLHALSEEVGPERSLLVCCTAFQSAPDQWPNLTLKKIPKAVTQRCEWGRDDYSLAISNLPQAEPVEDAGPPTGAAKKGARSKKASQKAGAEGQADLFATEGEQA